MADCCNDKACAIDALRTKQSATLRIVLAINAVMFVVEFAAGLMARSTALLSDSLDNLGDATTYALSLYVVSRSDRAKARVALFKGMLILGAALFVLIRVAYAIVNPSVPVFEAMGIVSLVALAANGTCVALLWKHRHEDINMTSVWECSRNDIASNVAVLLAAGLVWASDVAWPDLVVGFALAALLLWSAAKVLTGALSQLRSGAVA
jgi:cation diffusion facilitator family transporter